MLGVIISLSLIAIMISQELKLIHQFFPLFCLRSILDQTPLQSPIVV